MTKGRQIQNEGKHFSSWAAAGKALMWWKEASLHILEVIQVHTEVYRCIFTQNCVIVCLSSPSTFLDLCFCLYSLNPRGSPSMPTPLQFTAQDNQALMIVIVCIHTAKDNLHKKLGLAPQQCMMFLQTGQTFAGKRGKEQKKGNAAAFLLSWAWRFSEQLLNLERHYVE